MNELSQTDLVGYREQAILTLSHGAESAAERSFARLLEKKPCDLDAVPFLAIRHVSRDEVNKAIECLILAYHSPDNAAVLYQLGRFEGISKTPRHLVA